MAADKAETEILRIAQILLTKKQGTTKLWVCSLKTLHTELPQCALSVIAKTIFALSQEILVIEFFNGVYENDKIFLM